MKQTVRMIQLSTYLYGRVVLFSHVVLTVSGIRNILICWYHYKCLSRGMLLVIFTLYAVFSSGPMQCIYHLRSCSRCWSLEIQ